MANDMTMERWTQDRMTARVVRYGDLIPCTAAFIDAKTPGSHLKENFTIIGPGVAENPRQHVHIREAHGFNIGGARQPPRITNSPHSHETAEVFMIHTGQWRFDLGPRGEDGSTVLNPGDVISIPIHLFRGFENVGEVPGFMFAVLGGDDPGHVTWAPQVIREATGHGLILLEDGRLIDTTAGDKIPAGAAIAHPLSDAQMRRFRRDGAAVLGIARHDSIRPTPAIGIPGFEAETEAVIGLDAPAPIAWPHGFVLRRIKAASGRASRPHRHEDQSVYIVHSGSWRIDWRDGASGGSIELKSGDTFTMPPGMIRTISATGPGESVSWLVLRGDRPAAPMVLAA
jgi:mannose-6-phosphate isomerase-like protein (cupin superfamily)